jgi:predicted ester cyclase
MHCKKNGMRPDQKAVIEQYISGRDVLGKSLVFQMTPQGRIQDLSKWGSTRRVIIFNNVNL